MMHQVRPRGPLKRPQADREARPQGQPDQVDIRPQGALLAAGCAYVYGPLRCSLPGPAEGALTATLWLGAPR
jgi:hypothetical protein